jgi:hypothetical protein
MAAICFSNTVTTAGTPQKLVPPNAQILAGGVTFPVGSATLRGYQIQLQAAPGNVAAKNIYVGNSNMVVSTKVGCGMALLSGSQPISLGQFGGGIDIADLYIDTDAASNGTEKILITILA